MVSWTVVFSKSCCVFNKSSVQLPASILLKCIFRPSYRYHCNTGLSRLLARYVPLLSSSVVHFINLLKNFYFAKNRKEVTPQLPAQEKTNKVPANSLYRSTANTVKIARMRRVFCFHMYLSVMVCLLFILVSLADYIL